MELWITAIASFAALIFCAWKGSRSVIARVRRWITRAASHPLRACTLLIILAGAVYALPSILFRIPAPVVHDEFGYLLQGDTFAHGRLTNPPHPMREFFETFHILQTPTYAAKFPPGPGMTLAVGYWLGLPLLGNWMMLLAGACAIFWMMRAAMPPRWALLVALLAALHPTVLWFSQIYWGGAVALAGGALLAGAVIRAIKSFSPSPCIQGKGRGEGCLIANQKSQIESPRTPLPGPFPEYGAREQNSNHASMGFIAGAGMGLLMVSRPFEGMLLSVTCAFAMLIFAYRNRRVRSLLHFAAASMVLPLLTGGWLLYYNWRVTGDPALLPYVLHSRRYMAAPLFYFSATPPLPAYPNDQIRSFYTGLELAEYARHAHGFSYLLGIFDRAGMILWAYLRPVLLIVPLVVALIWTRGWIVITSILICIAALALHVTVSPWMRPAYMAPLMGLLLFPIGLGLRRLYVWRLNGQPIGRALAGAVILTQLIMGVFELARDDWSNSRQTIAQRERILTSLEKQGGRHLVLVQYTPDSTHEQEWVYNGADIDASPVIFARDLGKKTDQKLLAYYHDRAFWTVKVSPRDAIVSPYEPDALITP